MSIQSSFAAMGYGVMKIIMNCMRDLSYALSVMPRRPSGMAGALIPLSSNTYTYGYMGHIQYRGIYDIYSIRYIP
jgi:hypothetical protein